MTRINVGIKPSELTGKHLLAEHREIKRVPNVIKSGRYHMKGQPAKFTLGTGHVKFFYDKLGYLKKRYNAIHEECLKRGYNVTNFSEAFKNIPSNMMNDYTETSYDRKIIQERIAERLGK
tara:strand:- start:81 stop:440 length:360 start_codon:yes stop_codon:yes gene_type:complete